MRPFLEGCVGNPAAAHALGEEARDSLAAARAKIARLVGGRPSGVVFVSGATEANNLAVKGVAERGPGRHLVTTEVEHPSILAPCRDLQQSGYEVTCVTVNGDGRVDPAEVREAIRPDTCLVSMGAANGEVGAVQPWRAIARVTRELGVPFHVDAVGVLGRLPLSVEADGIDLLTVSANDLCGPPGVGALWIRPGLALRAQTQGGDQEAGLRAGTQNLAGAVGLGVAAELALRDGPAEAARLLRLRDRLIDGLTERCRAARLIGPRRERLPHHVSVAVAGVAAERLVQALDLVGISVSLREGGAGGVSAPGTAPLLATAPGADRPPTQSGLAVSLGRWTSADEVEVLLAELPPIVERLRERPGGDR
jgi:cysteine desulfurase